MPQLSTLKKKKKALYFPKKTIWFHDFKTEEKQKDKKPSKPNAM